MTTSNYSHNGESRVSPSESRETGETPLSGESLFPVGEGLSETGLTQPSAARPGTHPEAKEHE